MNFVRAVAPLFVERRTAERTRIACEARLRTPFSVTPGELCDLSTMGARFVTETPPKACSSALLEWEAHEVMCRVVWAKDGMCGLQFDRPISRAVIDRSASVPEKPTAVAALGNIPLGKRRSLLARGE